MTNISHNEQIKTQFLRTSRNLTLALLVLIIAVSAIFWTMGVDVQGTSSVATGLVLLALAVIFYKLPHLTYLFMVYRYKNEDATGKSILDDGWPAFKRWIEQD